MKVSINDVWDDTLAFVRAERGLVVPLVLGTLFLAQVLSVAIAITRPPGAQLLVLIAVAWGLVGQLALIDLALGSRRSVREALQTGLKRVLPAILIYLLFTLSFMVACAPLLVALAGLGYTAEQLPRVLANQVEIMKLSAALPAWANLYLMLLVGVAMFLFVRLLLWKASLVEQGRAIAALKDSWARTRGRFWRLFGLVLLAGLVIQLVTWALDTALGATFLLIGRATGATTTAQIVPALTLGLVAVAFRAVITVFLARLYRRTAA